MVARRIAQCSNGWEWTKQRREKYANNLDNPEQLIAVKAYLNRGKSDKGPDKWMLPNADYHPQYVTDRQAQAAAGIGNVGGGDSSRGRHQRELSVGTVPRWVAAQLHGGKSRRGSHRCVRGDAAGANRCVACRSRWWGIAANDAQRGRQGIRAGLHRRRVAETGWRLILPVRC